MNIAILPPGTHFSIHVACNMTIHVAILYGSYLNITYQNQIVVEVNYSGKSWGKLVCAWQPLIISPCSFHFGVAERSRLAWPSSHIDLYLVITMRRDQASLCKPQGSIPQGILAWTLGRPLLNVGANVWDYTHLNEPIEISVSILSD